MTLPRGDEYNLAVQNPRVAFLDNDLKSSLVQTTPLGLPKPYSGGFTITYKLSRWAVRCFHRDIQDLQRRYQAITNFQNRCPSRYFIEAKYLKDGIKVNGYFYPIIKMEWVDGDPINIYLDNFYLQKNKIEGLLSDFLNLISELEHFGIAHGDLQHGNIIVKNDKLFLIDYDGMYLPELSSLKTNEIGHINYQHPKRTATHYNKNIDRFSAIIIYIGLKAISLKSSLWKKYDNSENILFKSTDYANLRTSRLIKELLAIPELKLLTERLIGCCYLNFDKIPSLIDFISGNFAYDKNVAGKISITRHQYLIFDAKSRGSILEHFGEKVEIIGKIDGIKSSKTKYGDSYCFLNFGFFPNHTLTLVIWKEGISALLAKGIQPSSLVGKYVSITGIISSYGNKPQITVELPSQIQILNGQAEANQRLNFTHPITRASEIKTSTPIVEDKEKKIFDELYGNKAVTLTRPASNIPKSTNTYKPTNQASYRPPYTTPTQSKKKNNDGCTIPIIGAIMGAFILGIISEGKLWFFGAIGGGILGGWLQGKWFD